MILGDSKYLTFIYHNEKDFRIILEKALKQFQEDRSIKYIVISRDEEEVKPQ